ncbi:ribonucleoside-diphosphate reductase, adenosylcobalamin-dependent, partial [bacterium]|nr:ribonucleoside-diphosphate reductase, adenosylcobalamin-dependent [bacterium]
MGVKIYTRDEVFQNSKDYFGGDDLAASVFITKYALQDKEGNFLELNPDDMHKRLAAEFARIESNYSNPLSQDEIYKELKNFKKIVPQGSPMAGIGNINQIQSISNCFVIDSPQDSYGGILLSDQELVQIAKRRGGIGFDISTIRPKGELTANAARTTDGIEIFMERFSNSTREVAQGGRRGALMLTISVHHPQIRDFINIKQDLTKVTGANISVRLTDEFMNAVQKNKKVQLRWPIDSIDPEVVDEVNALELWDEIIKNAHSSAEPGLLFWDTAKRMTPADIYADDGFGSISTNPCGEIILSPYDSCRLMVVNLTGFVSSEFTSSAFFDFDEFG